MHRHGEGSDGEGAAVGKGRRRGGTAADGRMAGSADFIARDRIEVYLVPKNTDVVTLWCLLEREIMLGAQDAASGVRPTAEGEAGGGGWRRRGLSDP